MCKFSVEKKGLRFSQLATILRDGILQRSYDVIDDCYTWSDCLWSLHGEGTFFSDRYRSEIHSIFNLMHVYTQGDDKPKSIPTDDYESFRQFGSFHTESLKRILQHVYTHDPIKGKEMFEQIKESVFLYERQGGTDKIKRYELLKNFMKEFYKLKVIQTSLPNPDFGACEYCLKDIGWFSKVRKHKKFLKNADPKMWDIFSVN